MIVFKKRLPIEATRLCGAGLIETDRGDKLHFVAGDWLLTSQDGQQWPVSDAYLKSNYEMPEGEVDSEGGHAD